MAFPLVTVLAAAPGIISAAADIIGAIRHKKQGAKQPQAESERIDELVVLIEQQAMVIEELALNNRNMALAVRNNRVLSGVSIGLAVLACGLAVWL